MATDTLLDINDNTSKYIFMYVLQKTGASPNYKMYVLQKTGASPNPKSH